MDLKSWGNYPSSTGDSYKIKSETELVKIVSKSLANKSSLIAQGNHLSLIHI